MDYLLQLKLQEQPDCILFQIPIDVLGLIISILDAKSNANLRLTCSRFRILCCKYLVSLGNVTIDYKDLLNWTQYSDNGKPVTRIREIDGTKLTISTRMKTLIELIDPKFNGDILLSPKHITRYLINDDEIFQPYKVNRLLHAIADSIDLRGDSYEISIDLDPKYLKHLEDSIANNSLKQLEDELRLEYPNKKPSKRIEIPPRFNISYINSLLSFKIQRSPYLPQIGYDYSYLIERAKIIRYNLIMKCHQDTRIDNVWCKGDEISHFVDNDDTDIERIFMKLKIIYHNITETDEDIPLGMDMADWSAIKAILMSNPTVQLVIQSHQVLLDDIRSSWLYIADSLLSLDDALVEYIESGRLKLNI